MYSRDRADITQLKNMPVLEHLRLTGTPVTLMSLEIMHHNLPTIKSLHLRVHLRSGDTPRNVLAASLITTLKISICTAEDLHTHLQFYKYIYSKYPSVMDVTYNDEHELVDVDVDYVRDIYNEGILPLYQRVEFQTDTFYFGDYCDGLDAFRKFDGFGIKLKYLGIETYRDDVVLRLADLTQSQQSKYIETLALQNVIPEPIHLMKNMMALTCMEIATVYSDGGPYCEELLAIDFNQLVDACPASLTDLTLSRLDLTFNEPTSNQTSITYLNLSDLCLEPALAKTIETSFPQLSELEFDGEIQHGTIISLPNHNLEFVDIKIIIWQIGRYGFVVTTTSDNRVEYYDENGQLGSNNDDTHLPREDFDGGPVLSLTCASVNCLSLKTVSLLQVKYNKLNK
jgi:hypothetical protein